MSETAFDVLKMYIDSEHSGAEFLADDAVFTMMSTGQQWRGKEEITGMLHYFYQVAFNAHAVTRKLFASDRYGCLEADVVGTHTGEFAGVPATGKPVKVPMTVVYEIFDGKIHSANIYYEIPALMTQLGVTTASPAAAS